MSGKMKQTCLILSASTYAIPDEKTGEIKNSGLTIFYLPTDNLSPTEDPTAQKRGQMSKGMQPAKISFPKEMQQKVNSVPGMYELTLQMVVRQLKTQIQPVDIDFIGDVDLQLAKPVTNPK